MSMVSISKMADILGVHADTLRNYERQGIIKPLRIGTGKHRRYDVIKTLATLFDDGVQTLTGIQKEALAKPCPHCEVGELHEVNGDHRDEETGFKENYLWCNNCDLSMDCDGGYTC